MCSHCLTSRGRKPTFKFFDMSNHHTCVRLNMTTSISWTPMACTDNKIPLLTWIQLKQLKGIILLSWNHGSDERDQPGLCLAREENYLSTGHGKAVSRDLTKLNYIWSRVYGFKKIRCHCYIILIYSIYTSCHMVSLNYLCLIS